MCVIAVDFDSTLFIEEYPFVGEPIPGAIETIKKWYNMGNTIIIWSCREEETAEEAILALENEGAKYHYFNHNAPERIKQYNGDSRKVGCDVIIDDKALPFLITGINWKEINQMMDIYFSKQ